MLPVSWCFLLISDMWYSARLWGYGWYWSWTVKNSKFVVFGTIKYTHREKVLKTGCLLAGQKCVGYVTFKGCFPYDKRKHGATISNQKILSILKSVLYLWSFCLCYVCTLKLMYICYSWWCICRGFLIQRSVLVEKLLHVNPKWLLVGSFTWWLSEGRRIEWELCCIKIAEPPSFVTPKVIIFF